ncbi:MAG TPA: hypothetical protein VGF94_27375 [Kofleriaceae bacterium]|jgi:hypothetical protein
MIEHDVQAKPAAASRGASEPATAESGTGERYSDPGKAAPATAAHAGGSH